MTQAQPLRWRALGVTQAAAFMALLDVSIVNVALPSIENDMSASPGSVQWVVSGYALTFGLALVPAGRLGDSLGRRRMFMIGVAAFVVTSALTGLAPTTGLLVAARLLQGLAGGTLVPQNSGLIQELFTGAERGRAFGILGATIGLATATGPVVGGLILTAVTGPDAWRWVFFINVPIGLVTLLLARRFIPTPRIRGRTRADLDVAGSLLLGAAVLTLLLPLIDAGSGGLGPIAWLWVASILLFVAFARWEARTVRVDRQPLLHPNLLKISGFLPGAVIGLAYFVGFTGIWLVLAMYFQHGLGFTPLRSGLAVSPFALGVATSAALAGRLVNRAGRWLTVCGLVATIGGLAVTAFVLKDATAATAWRPSIPLAVAGLGGGMVTSPNITLSLQNVPVAMAGAAGGALQTAQRIGSAIGTAVLATIFYRLLNASGNDYASSIRDTILTAAGIMLIALLLAAVDLLRNRRPAPPPRVRVERPEHEGSPPCADAPAGVVTHPRP
ncbi:MFS transporter [Hamadaea tsunoensis]|uniref:MFS transporter n=1 Tax=Hamadaea tsunoensis TaxID=53368 RepID=UPI0007E8E48E|nr:MFS transporter [Hamadaea tsunoensis]